MVKQGCCDGISAGATARDLTVGECLQVALWSVKWEVSMVGSWSSFKAKEPGNSWLSKEEGSWDGGRSVLVWVAGRV